MNPLRSQKMLVCVSTEDEIVEYGVSKRWPVCATGWWW